MNENRPVKVGDVIDVKIEAVGEKGDGIAKKDGFVLFVPNTAEGDQVQVRVTKVLRRVGFAEVVGAPAAKTHAKQEPAEDVGDTEDFGEEPEEETVDTDDLKESDDMDFEEDEEPKKK
jgi:predicted RNA-binding protein with TRAM domain